MKPKIFLLHFLTGTMIWVIAKLIAPNSFTCGWFAGIFFHASMYLIDLYYDKER